MAHQVLALKQIESATGTISCGEEQGTLFLVTPNQAITARHILFDEQNNLRDSPIQIEFPALQSDETVIGRLYRHYPELDMAIIDLPEDFYSEHYLPLKCSQVAIDTVWGAFGYPSERIMTGVRVKGTVSQVKQTHVPWDLTLNQEREGQLASYKGLSGAAVVADGYVIGMAVHEDGNSLFAVSSQKLQPILDAEEIVYTLTDNEASPSQKTLHNFIENESTLEMLNNMIETKRRGYISLNGQPGSGKTTFVELYDTPPENYEILGRYLVRIPGEDVFPRVQQETFVQWLEWLCHNFLYSSPPPKQAIEESLKAIPKLLAEVGGAFQARESTAILLIDGLDDVKESGNINQFLGFLPEELPPGLVCVFSCTSNHVLPTKFQAQVQDAFSVPMQSLEHAKVIAYLNSELDHVELSASQIHTLATRSEGHPLYLRYLIETLKYDEIDDIDSWLKELPVIEGNIKIYYQKLWIPLELQREQYWLTILLSRLRQSVDADMLKAILPGEQRIGFISNLKAIRHLLQERGTKLSVYHASFSRFVQDATTSLHEDIHEAVAIFCLKHQETEFSTTNIIFHLLQSQDRQRALEHCSQEWADKCALKHVSPDFVINDISNVISFCAVTGQSTELVRALLLLQRIRFRYDLLLKDYAPELADALLALKQPDKALSYIVRNEELVVPFSLAPATIRRFSECRAYEQADHLRELIRKRYYSKMEELIKESSIEPEVFLIYARSLICHPYSKDVDDEFHNLLDYLNRLSRSSEADGAVDIHETIKSIINDIVGYQRAYLLYRNNLHRPVQELFDAFARDGREVTTEMTLLYAIMAVYYQQIRSDGKIFHASENEAQFIRDLERLIEDVGYEPQFSEIIAKSLYRGSKRPDLVSVAIEHYISSSQPKVLELRAGNGADVHKDFPEIFEYQILCGYYGRSIDTQIPELQIGNWENWLQTLSTHFAYAIGAAYRVKASHNEPDFTSAFQMIQNIFSQINFAFKDRCLWENAYLLPEGIIPELYRRYLQCVLAFAPDELPSLIRKIESSASDQMGLYSEGYRDVLLSIAQKLNQYRVNKADIYKLLTLLEAHIEGIQNRWEKVPLLLKVLELYGNMNHKTKADKVYREILAFSMGPSWYKDDQFTLITTTISSLGLQENQLQFLSVLAGALDFASAEMTFQDYITQTREEFISEISDSGFVEKAVTLFQNWLIPPLSQIKENAEYPTIDMPETGNGFNLGARYVNEKNVVAKLLKKLSDAHPLVQWAFSEAFIYGDLSNASTFARIQARAINSLIEAQDEALVENVLQRLMVICRYVLSQMHERPSGRYYFSQLFSGLNADIAQRVKSMLSTDESVYSDPSQDIRSEPNAFTQAILQEIEATRNALAIEDSDSAKSHILSIFHQYSSERKISAWYENWDHELEEAWTLLRTATQTDSELVEFLAPFFNDARQDEWRVANHLIHSLAGKLTSSQKDSIYSHILDHFCHLVSPPSKLVEKYGWLGDMQGQEEKNKDFFLTSLLTWFLNHPGTIVRSRVEQAISWLLTCAPELIVPSLIEETLTKNRYASSFCASRLLRDATPFLAKENFVDKNTLSRIFSRHHFGIQYNYLQLFESFQSRQESDVLQESTEQLKTILCGQEAPETANSSLTVFNQYLGVISDTVFQVMQCLRDSSPFLAVVELVLSHYCENESLQIQELPRVASYLHRSFYKEPSQHDAYNEMLLSALHEASVGNIKETHLDNVYQLLKG